MKKPIVVALIVTRSISLAEGLEALLNAIPQIDKVETARSVEKALQKIEDGKPGIVLLEAIPSGNETQRLLEKVKSLSPNTQRVLLVDDVNDMKWMPQFAEAILIKGASPSAVVTILTSLLEAKGDLI